MGTGSVAGLGWKLTGSLLLLAAIPMSIWYVGPAEGFTLGGHAAKIIFFHVPCAWIAVLAYLVAFWYGWQHLATVKSGPRQRRPVDRRAVVLWSAVACLLMLAGGRWRSGLLVPLAFLAAATWRPDAAADRRSSAAMEIGLLFAFLATVTGSVFSRFMWGAYWNWDPRQTSIVIVMLIMAAYGVLRGAIEDPETRARLSAVYAVVSLVPALFLLIVLPRVTETLHSGPNRTLTEEMVSFSFRLVMYGFALPGFIALFAWMAEMRVRVESLRTRPIGGS